MNNSRNRGESEAFIHYGKDLFNYYVLIVKAIFLLPL